MLDFLKFYNRPQTYRAEIRIELRNTGNTKKATTLTVPVPMTTAYQTTMPRFDERSALYEIDLKPGEQKVILVPFKAHVMPRRYEGRIAPEITRANQFVIEYLTYGNPIDGLYTAQEARDKRVVDCGGFDTLLQDELKKKDIESNVVAGFWSDGNMHAWLEIGTIPADPSMEYLRKHGRTRKSGMLGFVGSDRIAFSTGNPFLQHPFLKEEDNEIIHENNFYCTRA